MKSRAVRHKDGTLEIIRLVDGYELMSASGEDALSQEASIVWLEDIKGLDYVRVLRVPTWKNRRGRLAVTGAGKVLGYSTLLPDAEPDPQTEKFSRRVFYLRNEDLNYKEGDPPLELKSAADPRTLLPASKGRKVATTEKLIQTDAGDDDSGQYVVTLRGSSVILDWVGDADLASQLKGDADESARSELDTMIDTGPLRGELRPEEGGPGVPLILTEVNMGRADECDVVLRYNNVSALHCKLQLKEGYWFIRDLNSTNGVMLNGKRLAPGLGCRVDPGAVISIANHGFELRYDPAEQGAVGTPPPPIIE
jgi:hypothetical protein